MRRAYGESNRIASGLWSVVMASEAKVREMKERYAAELLQQPGVSGVGVGRDEQGNPILVIHLDIESPDSRPKLPRELEGFPIQFVEDGPFYKFSQRSPEADGA
jgi:hypothetical protein